MRFKWLLVAVLLGMVTGRAHAQESHVSLAEYNSLFAELGTALAADPQADPDDLAGFARRLSLVESVELPGGQTVRVDHAYLVDLLGADPPDIVRLQRILDAYRAVNRQETSISEADQAALGEVLAKAEFQWQDETPNPLYALWQRFMDWMLRILDRIFPALDNASQLINAVIFTLLGIALLLIFRFIYRSTLKDLVREAEISAAGGKLEDLTSEQAASQAMALSLQGDRRSAVRYLYLSALIGLEEHGFLRADRSRTNHEFLTDLADRPDVLAQLADVTAVFDRVWYGFHPIDTTGVEVYSRQVEALKRTRTGTA